MVTETTKYALMAANPRAADRPAEGWSPEGRIVMTPQLPPNRYPFSVPLMMEFAFVETFRVDYDDVTRTFVPLKCLKFPKLVKVTFRFRPRCTR
jgi:hypothetical protein